MSEWGVPNWQDFAAYSNAGGWSLARWYWEFIRRRPDYRDEAIALLEALEARSLSDQEWSDYSARWGYSEILAPSVSDYSDDQLLTWPNKGVRSAIGSPVSRETLRTRIEPRSDEIAITLNLDKPIAPQLRIARKAAQKAQRARHGKVLIDKPRQAEWALYLRVLDAKATGAKLWEIGAGIEGIAAAQNDKNAQKEAAAAKLRQAQKVGDMIALSNTLTAV